MKCIFCRSTKTSVIESRPFDDAVERRRQCNNCNKRFTTVEMPISSNNHRKYKPIGRPPNNPDNYYTVYNAKTDDIIASGNASECARQLDIRLNSFYKAVTNSNRGESKKYYILTDKEKDIESYDD